jgi:hypothetical protein
MNLLPDILTDKQYKELEDLKLLNKLNVRNYNICMDFKKKREENPSIDQFKIIVFLQKKYRFSAETLRRVITESPELYGIKRKIKPKGKKQ